MTVLKAPCPHGRYDAHTFYQDVPISHDCPGGVLLPPDSLVIDLRASKKQLAELYKEWRPNATPLAMKGYAQRMLDALVVVQP